MVRIDQRPDLQFGFDLYTPVAFTSTPLDLSAEEYHVIGIEHDWNMATGQDTTTTLWLAKILTNSTSITPNTYLEEQIQAPLGYDNPAGDPDTLEPIYTTEEFQNIAIEPSYIQLSGASVDLGGDATISSTFVDWGSQGAACLRWVATPPNDVSTPGMQNPANMWIAGAGTDIAIIKAGIWFAKFVYYVDDSDDPNDDIDDFCEVRLYDIDGSTLMASSGQPRTQLSSKTSGDLLINHYPLVSDGLFRVTNNQIFKCYVQVAHGNDFMVHFYAYRIAPLPE